MCQQRPCSQNPMAPAFWASGIAKTSSQCSGGEGSAQASKRVALPCLLSAIEACRVLCDLKTRYGNVSHGRPQILDVDKAHQGDLFGPQKPLEGNSENYGLKHPKLPRL